MTVRADGSVRRERIYVGGFEVYRDYDDSMRRFERQTLHLLNGIERVALVDTVTVKASSAVASPAPVIRFQFSDHLGSACLELDPAAALIGYEEYGAYGMTTFQCGTQRGRGEPETLPLHGQGTRRGNGLLLSRTALLRALAVPLDQLRSAWHAERNKPLYLRLQQPIGLVDPSAGRHGRRPVQSPSSSPSPSPPQVQVNRANGLAAAEP